MLSASAVGRGVCLAVHLHLFIMLVNWACSHDVNGPNSQNMMEFIALPIN